MNFVPIVSRKTCSSNIQYKKLDRKSFEYQPETTDARSIRQYPVGTRVRFAVNQPRPTADDWADLENILLLYKNKINKPTLTRELWREEYLEHRTEKVIVTSMKLLRKSLCWEKKKNRTFFGLTPFFTPKRVGARFLKKYRLPNGTHECFESRDSEVTSSA
ncbi:hypothetical protein AVEN_116430-1 [Araneus ventricosus]|uniref:Uncharacterized protein n=1 Tax=Araneus ventricosus TaxID=182803 RepID=A0A4Y2KIT8_ARAVE|nr:hypothetical protein AVEN_116430-1 [Araneus ventricosus]